MKLHAQPEQAEWDRRILSEMSDQYTFGDVFDWADMTRVLDVGAHIGGFTAWIKALNPDAQIAAVEAERENFDLAVGNVGHLPGVVVYYGALHYGYVPMTLHTFREDHNAGSHTLQPLMEGGTAYEAPIYDLKSLLVLRGWKSVDAIKLDCEGSEYSILAHADMQILRNVKVIVGEYHDGPQRFRDECVSRLCDVFDVVYLNTAAPLGGFCLINKDHASCG